MFLIAHVPPLWYRIMDKRLLEAVGHDPRKINVDPGKHTRLMKKYGLRDTEA